jgi:hypothetical protein
MIGYEEILTSKRLVDEEMGYPPASSHFESAKQGWKMSFHSKSTIFGKILGSNG